MWHAMTDLHQSFSKKDYAASGICFEITRLVTRIVIGQRSAVVQFLHGLRSAFPHQYVDEPKLWPEYGNIESLSNQ